MIRIRRSKWASTPQKLRRRKIVQITISPEAIAKLARMADVGSRSAFIERLILDAEEGPTK
jgi:hypothetical protein